eukprot:2182749-Amphidinium_carterae.1
MNGSTEVPDRQRPYQKASWAIKTCRHSKCRAYRYKAAQCSASEEASPMCGSDQGYNHSFRHELSARAPAA